LLSLKAIQLVSRLECLAFVDVIEEHKARCSTLSKRCTTGDVGKNTVPVSCVAPPNVHADDLRIDGVDRRCVERIADQYAVTHWNDVGIEIVVDEVHVVVVAQRPTRTVNGTREV